MTKVRFAPSPTGKLHLGNVRVALFNWLLARHTSGCFVLRIEDTDVRRSTSQAEETILEDLRWLGLHWDEGPYRQSERLPVYRKYAGELIGKRLAYPCFCTPEDLERERKEQISRGQPPRYGGRCRDLTEEAKTEFRRKGREPALRFRANAAAQSQESQVRFRDLVRGELSFEAAGIGDFVLLKADGTPAYNFAVVVDDALMGITHVLRGEDHLSNTPRQLLLYRALGWSPPQFGHLPLILGPDGQPLSKRHGDTSVSRFRNSGYLPEAMAGYLATLGWSPKNDKGLLYLSGLAEQFSVDKLSKSPSIFDQKKLTWLNGRYIQALTIRELTAACLPYLQAAGYIRIEPPRLAQLLSSVQAELKTLAEVADKVRVYLEQPEPDPEAKAVLQQPEAGRVIAAAIKQLAGFQELTPENFPQLIQELRQELGVGGRKLYQPLRAALTGCLHGPELVQLFTILGREEIIARLDKRINIT